MVVAGMKLLVVVDVAFAYGVEDEDCWGMLGGIDISWCVDDGAEYAEEDTAGEDNEDAGEAFEDEDKEDEDADVAGVRRATREE